MEKELNIKEKYIDVDVFSICSISHICTSCNGQTMCCCSNYEVILTECEMIKIIGLMPEMSKFCRYLKSKEGYKNVFDKIGPKLYCIDTDHKGLCCFAYRKNKRIYCSIHSSSLYLGIPFYKIKPTSCLLWPLIISKMETPILSIHTDALEYICNIKNHGRQLYLSPSIAKNIEYVFGKKFRYDLECAALKGLHRVKIFLEKNLNKVI